MNNEEIVQEILDTIVYGKEPGLQEVSCTGIIALGIDKDANFHKGFYTLEGTTYTVLWYRDTVKILKGRAAGWTTVPKGITLHEGRLDWKRLRQAFVMEEVYRQMGGKEAADSQPNLRDSIKIGLLSNEKFMLNSAIVEALETRNELLKNGDMVTTGSLCAANVFVKVIGDTTLLRMGKEFRTLNSETLEELLELLSNANDIAKDCGDDIPVQEIPS